MHICVGEWFPREVGSIKLFANTTMKKAIKIFLTLLGTLVLGALGSGLWERVFSRCFDWLVTTSVNMMSRLVANYQDSIYADVSNGFNEYSAVFVHILILMLLPTMYFYIWVRHPLSKQTSDNHVREFIRSRRGYYTLGFVTLSLFVTFAISSFKILYTNRIVTHSLKSIDMIAPHLTELEQRRLMAEFRSIVTKKDYDTFATHLASLAKTNGVVLLKMK